jgi:hypothetical protein
MHGVVTGRIAREYASPMRDQWNHAVVIKSSLHLVAPGGLRGERDGNPYRDPAK